MNTPSPRSPPLPLSARALSGKRPSQWRAPLLTQPTFLPAPIRPQHRPCSPAGWKNLKNPGSQTPQVLALVGQLLFVTTCDCL